MNDEPQSLPKSTDRIYESQIKTVSGLSLYLFACVFFCCFHNYFFIVVFDIFCIHFLLLCNAIIDGSNGIERKERNK